MEKTLNTINIKNEIANKLIERYKDKKLIKLDNIVNSIITGIVYDKIKGGYTYYEIVDVAWEIMDIIHKED